MGYGVVWCGVVCCRVSCFPIANETGIDVLLGVFGLSQDRIKFRAGGKRMSLVVEIWVSR